MKTHYSKIKKLPQCKHYQELVLWELVLSFWKLTSQVVEKCTCPTQLGPIMWPLPKKPDSRLLNTPTGTKKPKDSISKVWLKVWNKLLKNPLSYYMPVLTTQLVLTLLQINGKLLEISSKKKDTLPSWILLTKVLHLEIYKKMLLPLEFSKKKVFNSA